MGNATTPQIPGPRGEERAVGLQMLLALALLQRERGGGGSSDQQKERFTGKQQKGMWPKPCRRLAVHELGTCRRAGKGQGGLRGERTHGAAGEGIFCSQSMGYARGNTLTCLLNYKGQSKFPQGKPLLLPEIFPTRVFSCFLHIFFFFKFLLPPISNQRHVTTSSQDEASSADLCPRLTKGRNAFSQLLLLLHAGGENPSPARSSPVRTSSHSVGTSGLHLFHPSFWRQPWTGCRGDGCPPWVAWPIHA